MIDRRRLILAAGAAAASLGLSPSRQALGASSDTAVLRVVPLSNPSTFDPHQTTAYTTTSHAALIYDTLFSWDGDMVAKPQMVETWERSPNGLKYRFRLRPGLRFHDGSAVTTRDVIASLRRMFLRDGQNQLFASLVSAMESIDDRTFELRLREPFGFVEFLIGGSNNVTGAIMREKEALTDPFTPVRELIGSGPFRFVASEFNSGAKIVYERFAEYVPRAEKPSGFAGGKVAKVQRVEWIIMPDAATAYSALRTGEVDILDAPTIELLPTILGDPKIVVGEVWPVDSQAVLRLNWLWPPFDNIKARQAVAHALSQTDMMQAGVGDDRYWRLCHAYWICGSPNGTQAGSEPYRTPNLELAKRLLAESGYRGEPVVMIGGGSNPLYRQMSLVTADTLGKIGMKVDLQLTDVGTWVARRVKKDAPSSGGWNMFHTMHTGVPGTSPLLSVSTIMACDGKNFPGWPCDALAEQLRQSYIGEADPVRRKEILEKMHKRLWEVIPYVLLGQIRQPFAWRSNIRGVLKANNLVYWNIEKL